MLGRRIVMKKFVQIALAAIVAGVGVAPAAHAALSDRDVPVWRATADIQIAGRGGDRGGKNDGSRNDGGRGRDSGRDKNGDVIWRIRKDRERPFFLFRGRGDCTMQQVKVRDLSGNLVIRDKRVCN